MVWFGWGRGLKAVSGVPLPSSLERRVAEMTAFIKSQFESPLLQGIESGDGGSPGVQTWSRSVAGVFPVDWIKWGRPQHRLGGERQGRSCDNPP